MVVITGVAVGASVGAGVGVGAGVRSECSGVGAGDSSPIMVIGTCAAPAVKSLLNSSNAPWTLAELDVLITWVVAVKTVVTTTVPKGGIEPKRVVKSVHTSNPGVTRVGVGTAKLNCRKAGS